MKNTIYILLPTCFMVLMLSGWLCMEYKSYKYIIFYLISIPSLVGLFVSAMILAVMTIGKNE